MKPHEVGFTTAETAISDGIFGRTKIRGKFPTDFSHEQISDGISDGKFSNGISDGKIRGKFIFYFFSFYLKFNLISHGFSHGKIRGKFPWEIFF